MAATGSSFESLIEDIKTDPSVSRVSVIKDIGDFEKVVTIRAEEFTLKLQIPRSSSDDLTPSVSLQSSRLSGNNLEALGNILQDFARDHKTEQSLIMSLFSLCKTEVSDTPVTTNVSGSAQKTKVLPKKKTKQKQRNTNASSEVKSTKKPSMKTAEDVVKRVLWDESISQEDISIGYIDRFTGLQEKPFIAFSWEDLASIDYFTFAIPKHRIQYFKYKLEVIWDKSLRMDNVFGSAGSNRTIQEVIAEYKEEDHQKAPPVPTSVAPVSNPAPMATESVAALAHLNLSDNFGAYGASDSDEDPFANDSSDDDGVVVTVDNDKSSEVYSQSEDEEEDDEGGRVGGGVAFRPTDYWRDKIRPNFFLCVRVTAPEVMEAVARVQKVVLEREPRYASCCVSPCMLHVTLCTLRLNNAEEASNCLQVLRKFSSEIRDLLPSSPLRLSGLDRFFHRVLFANARHGPDFLPFVEHVCTVLRSEGIRLMDHHDFVPHMTVMKVSRPVARQMGTKFIASEVFEGLEQTEFGEQLIDSIYLCSMEKERGPDGFYLSPGCLTFSREVLGN